MVCEEVGNSNVEIIKLIYNMCAAFLVGLIIVVGISAIPFPHNYKLYTVTSGSMEPTILRGSVVIVKPIKEYKVHDIVTIHTQEPGKTVTHRIIKKIEKDKQVTFKTKGDANTSKDSEVLLPQNIIGKVFFSIPIIGYPIAFSKTLPGLIILIVIPATIIIYNELITIKNEALRLIQKRKQRKLSPLRKRTKKKP